MLQRTTYFFSLFLLSAGLFYGCSSGTSGDSTTTTTTSQAVQTCTHGIDCYCDKVRTGGQLADAQLLFCEDWEAPTLYKDVGFGMGPPDYGPWYDHTDRSMIGQPNHRGLNSYWSKHYTAGLAPSRWQTGQPSNPTFGVACGATLCDNGAFKPGDPWQANNFAFIGILATGDFNFEVSGLTNPTNTANGTPGAFDGSYVLAQRTKPADQAGISGRVLFNPTTHLGITYAMAYPVNTQSTGILLAPWKHNEWEQVDNPSALDGLSGFHGDSSPGGMPPSYFPFYGFILYSSGSTQPQAQCQTAIDNSMVKSTLKGTLLCDVDFLKFFGDTVTYNQATDFPFGTWGCIRAEYDFTMPTNASIKMWFQGQGSNGEKLVLSVTGLDATFLGAKGGYNRMHFNTYANANAPGYPTGPTTKTQYRYEDNFHVRSGAPVPCSQIGFK